MPTIPVATSGLDPTMIAAIVIACLIGVFLLYLIIYTGARVITLAVLASVHSFRKRNSRSQ